MFGMNSKKQLLSAHPDLQRLFNEVVKHYDCVVIVGQRNKADQDAAVKAGNSQTPWPTSKHNSSPSLAVDVAPYFDEKPHIRWNDIKSFYHFAGFVKGVASQMGIPIRFGGDWDSDWDLEEEKFRDLVHFELGKR